MDSGRLRRVLVVDDEPNIVSAVRRELSTPPLGRYRYEVEGSSDPAAALEMAKSRGFDAVVTDFRMPGIDGLAFLKAFSALQPACARLVLSGQTDMETLAKMINETHIFRFVPKPWHDYFLKSSLAQAIAFGEALQENHRLADLVRARGIPIPPLLEGETDHVLVVDDEPAVLASLARSLAGGDRLDGCFAAIRAEVAHSDAARLEIGEAGVEVAPSGAEALRKADGKQYACVIADLRMPDMSGIELLQRFLDRQPDCARILISGRATQGDLVDAVDLAHVFGFIGKPWEDYELRACVAQALAQRRMTIGNRILADMVTRAGGTA